MTSAADARGPGWRVLEGDCLEVLGDLPDQSIDAVLSDPPYGIDFQNAAWDGNAIRADAAQRAGRRLTRGQALERWAAEWGRECRRVLKPGGHLAAFGAPRTFHRIAAGLEDAGLELRDTLIWLYGTGMPKSRRYPGDTGTTLKPAWEPIILARAPTGGQTIKATHRRHGTGVLQLHAARHHGRYPTNVLLDHHPDCTTDRCDPGCPTQVVDATARLAGVPRSVSRLFYCPKASSKERDAGCHDLPAHTIDLFPQAGSTKSLGRVARNPHPTVKPLTLMRWLVGLLVPPGGLVLDPFCGSGSTGAAAVLEHRRFLGIERETDYAQISRARIEHWHRTAALSDSTDGPVGERNPFATAAKAAHR